MTIYFDMDGTIADLYTVDNWLPKLMARDASPYAEASPLLNFSVLARQLNKIRKLGVSIGIISWLAKNSTEEYDMMVTEAKINWLNKHLPSVEWNEIKIVPYGTPKQTVVDDEFGLLFDDEEYNRENWIGEAYDAPYVLPFLSELIALLKNQ